MPGVATAVRTLSSTLSTVGSTRPAPSHIMLVELDDAGNVPVDPEERRVFRFQHWPETINDTKSNTTTNFTVPGGSLPVYQWIAGGERNLSFTAEFAADTDLLGSGQMTGKILAEFSERNPDIRAALAWLRRYELPRYVTVRAGTTSVAVTKPPKRLRLFIPNSGIGLAGGYDPSGGYTLMDSVVVMMTQCDITWTKFFESGLPRSASVQLAFVQLPQYGGRMTFPADTEFMALGQVGPNDSGTPTFGYRIKAPPRRWARG